jgi:hypothetical protein
MAPTRLINTSDLSFETKFAHLQPGDDDHPRYAIISHRWGSDEINSQEFLYFTSAESARNDTVARILGIDLSKENGPGHRKVLDACETARFLGYEWMWIDTVCIDKTSSAELSEAINSMYAWYKSSAECLVYLSDVAYTVYQDSLFQNSNNTFWLSQWWKRGWTVRAVDQSTGLPQSPVSLGSQRSASMHRSLTGTASRTSCATVAAIIRQILEVYCT